MWFGNENYMTWMPAFAPGSGVALTSFTDSMQFQNGGGDRRRSVAGQVVYSMDFPARDATGYNAFGYSTDGLDGYQKFSSGYYGRKLVHIADPMNFDTNMMPRAWATPGLIEEGWPNITNVKPTFTSTGVTNFRMPLRQASWYLTTSTRPTRESRYALIPIPPTCYLAFGASGSAVANAAVRIDAFDRYGKFVSSVDATLLSTAQTTRTNTFVDGATAAYVKIYLTQKAASATPALITINSMMAQIRPGHGEYVYPSDGLYPGSALYPVQQGLYGTVGPHIPGFGHTGLEFADDAIVEEYELLDNHVKGLSFTLEEVGAWR